MRFYISYLNFFILFLSSLFLIQAYAEEPLAQQTSEDSGISEAHFWKPSDLFNKSADPYIPFLIKKKSELIMSDQDYKEESFRKENSSNYFLRRDISGNDIVMFIDDVDSNKNISFSE